MSTENNTETKSNADSISFSEWFRHNNPLYLFSVVLMLLGLYLVSSDAQAESLGVNGLVAFFAIQNVYEIAMVAMALYLLKNKIQPRHGKFLLAFVLLFLGDVTFYQVRISGLSVFHGNLATMIYFILGMIKFAAVIKILELTIYFWRIFYVAASFSLIWIGPKIAYNIMDSVGKAATSYFDATTIIYMLWMVAGLIHLPLIIQHWKHNRLEVKQEHELVGNETSFWRWLMIFPFIMLPTQLMLNVMVDSSLALDRSVPAVTLVLPWVLMAGFFIQTIWNRKLGELVKQNQYDSGLLITLLIISVAASRSGYIPAIINTAMALAGLFITFVTRLNVVNGFALGTFALFYSGQKLLLGFEKAVEYGGRISKVAWAAILMIVSFALLVLGFAVSLKKGDSDHQDPTIGNLDKDSLTEINVTESAEVKAEEPIEK